MKKLRYPSRNVKNKAVKLFTAAILVIAAAFGILHDYIAKETGSKQLLAATDGYFTAHYIDVGQGSAALLASPDDSFMLIDTGTTESSAYLVKYLKDAGVDTLDYLIITHPHEDHYGGAESVIKNFPVENFLILSDFTDTYPYDRFIYMLENNSFGADTNIEPVVRDDTFTFANDCVFRIISPEEADFDDFNESSLALKLIYGNTAFLFTGDSEKATENAMIANGYDLRADVFLAGHHGSATSNTLAFVQAVSPEYAVISCGKDNSYGHPHEDTLKNFESCGAEVLRTDISGSIIIVSDGNSVSLPQAQ